MDKFTNRQRETGSLHAVIIGVLFVSLMATLGVVFYQNFIANKPVTEQTDKPEEVKPLTTRIAFNSDIYSLDYPKEWKSVTTKKDESIPGSVTKITSPDQTIQVAFTVSGTAATDTCDINDGLKISHYNINKVAVANLTDTPVYLVEAITDSTGGGYRYTIGLTPDGGETHAAVGDSHCNVRYVGVASKLVLSGVAVIKPTIVAVISLPKLSTSKDGAIKDMRQIKDAMATDEYKAAVKILESARKE